MYLFTLVYVNERTVVPLSKTVILYMTRSSSFAHAMDMAKHPRNEFHLYSKYILTGTYVQTGSDVAGIGFVFGEKGTLKMLDIPPNSVRIYLGSAD